MPPRSRSLQRVHIPEPTWIRPVTGLSDGQGIDAAPLAALIGPAQVMEISDPMSITAEELSAYAIQRGERLLLKTRTSARGFQTNDFVQDVVYLSQAATRYLAAQQVQGVGVDYLPVGGYSQDGPPDAPGIAFSRGLDYRRIASRCRPDRDVRDDLFATKDRRQRWRTGSRRAPES